jgi:hypothetical protein
MKVCWLLKSFQYWSEKRAFVLFIGFSDASSHSDCCKEAFNLMAQLLVVEFFFLNAYCFKLI